MAKKETVEIRLSDEQAENLRTVARLAGCKPETVAAVLLALFVLKHPEHAAEPSSIEP